MYPFQEKPLALALRFNFTRLLIAIVCYQSIQIFIIAIFIHVCMHFITRIKSGWWMSANNKIQAILRICRYMHQSEHHLHKFFCISHPLADYHLYCNKGSHTLELHACFLKWHCKNDIAWIKLKVWFGVGYWEIQNVNGKERAT